MSRKLMKTILLVSLALVAAGASAQPPLKMASEVAEPPLDPKKKKPGEECSANDECQKHHSCKKEKDSEKGVCTAPPRRTIPPGAVT